MLKEIHKAVETFHKIAFGTKNNTSKLPESKLATFVTVLTQLLTTRYEKNWYPENPDRGSGYRCIRVNNQSVDPTIVESLKSAKIELSKGLICTELTIWVDPGVVSVRIGEDGSIGSEVVDEEVYSLGKRVKETSLKQSGMESDEGFSSRSSSPESSATECSWSTSSSASSSPIPSKQSASPTPPVMEYNPYSPPTRVSYPNHYHGPVTSLSSPQQPQRNSSPTVSHFQSQGIRSQGRPEVLVGPPNFSTPNGDHVGRQGHIPVSSAQHTAVYTRPRALFPSQDCNVSRAALDGIGKMAFNPYAMPVIYNGNLQQTNIFDIPAMA